MILFSILPYIENVFQSVKMIFKGLLSDKKEVLYKSMPVFYNRGGLPSFRMRKTLSNDGIGAFITSITNKEIKER